ncbi:MAG: Mth938-like domain-containing protein [Burkholderiaceae bacterium]
MKLHADTQTSLNTFTGYGPGFVEINGQRHEGSLLVMPEGLLAPWPAAGFESLEPAHFEALLGHRPELVLLGTGGRQRFPHPRLTAALAAARIGVDTMDTPAACRTYNILMAEGRRVLAALLQC